MNILLLFGVLFALILIGVPISFSVGVSSLLVLLLEGIPVTQLITKMFGGLDSVTLMAIPFYMLAGNIMTNGKLTQNLINLSDSIVGHIKGGLAHVNILASMFFAGISGSSTADSASIGAILVPAMVEEGYDRKFSAAITAASSSIGPIIPPSIMFIVYASLTGTSVGALFLGGIVPGVLLGISQMILCYFMMDKVYRPKDGIVKKQFSIKNIWEAFKKSILVLMMPIIILFGILGGIFTATEAGAIAAIYGLVISVFVYKTINIKNIGPILLETTKSVGMVLLLAATAAVFANVLTLLDFPTMTLNFLTALTDNPTTMLFIIIGFLFVLGFFIDGIPILIMFVPVLEKIIVQLGFDPVFFGVIAVMTVLIGGITPPVGVLLFVNARIAKISFDELVGAIWPFVFLMLFLVIILAIFPTLITFLPNTFLH